jgi:hypothetical protein
VIREDDRRTWYGSSGDGPFSLHLWVGIPDARERLADFVRYENSQGRIPVVALPEKLGGESYVLDALDHVPDQGIVREADPRWVVHSTSTESWDGIRSDGALRALSELDTSEVPHAGLGFRELGEPSEFAEYVALAPFESLAPEIVVSAKQKGRVCDDPDAPYRPQIRLFFDCHAIIRSRLAVRDGRHAIKVHRRLPLTPFLVRSLDEDDVGPAAGTTGWTPRSFTRAANEVFLSSTGRALPPSWEGRGR